MNDEGVPGRAARQDQLLEQASLWFARMRGPDAEAFRQPFEAWLSRDAAHLGAYNRAGEVFALGKFLAETPDTRSIETRNRGGTRFHWRIAAVAAGIVILMGTGLWLGRNLVATQFGATLPVAASGVPAPFARVATLAGERRTLHLSDGSIVTLEAKSVLSIQFAADVRALRLEQGRARFEVAHERRPFKVLAGGGSVTARGTIFDVIVDEAHGVTVHLLRGAVDVERRSAATVQGPSRALVTRLEPGESIAFADPLGRQAHVGPGTAVIGSSPLSTGAPAVEFEKASLSQVVERANAGSATSIRFADPAIGDLKVSGRFRIDDKAQLAERLASLFNLKVDQMEDGDLVLRAR